MKMLFHHPKATLEDWGFIPFFLIPDDPRPMKEQINERYQSGWHSIKGFVKEREDCLKYPGDPLLKPMAEIQLRSERLVLYSHAICAIFQPDGTFDVARLD